MSDQIQSGTPWVAATEPIVGEGWVQLGGTGSKKIFWDELSKADQAQVIQYLLSAQFPMLSPPQTVVDASYQNGSISSLSASINSVEQTKHSIIMGMLDQWSKSIQEQAERSKRADEKRALEGLAIAYHTYQHEVNLERDAFFPIFAVGMIIVGTGIQQALTPALNVTGVELNPIVSMNSAVIPPVMGDMRAVLGLIGAIYAAGIQYFTIAQLTAESAGKGEKPKNGEFARGYAENVVKLIGDPTFNAYLLAIVTRGTAEGESLSEQRVKELTAMIRVILLSSALAMLYKTEAGKMTSIEFMAMVKGEMKFNPNDIKATLIDLINSNLLNISPEIRKQVLESLKSYFDKDPDINTLSDPAKVFEGLYETIPRGDIPI